MGDIYIISDAEFDHERAVIDSVVIHVVMHAHIICMIFIQKVGKQPIFTKPNSSLNFLLAAPSSDLDGCVSIYIIHNH